MSIRPRHRAALLFALLCPSIALAWGPEGHRIVGNLAQRQLTPQAAAAVADLLRGEPDPTLAGVATWADDLRQTDKDLFMKTRTWHYDDFPRGDCDYVQPRDCPGDACATEQIPAQEKILADPSQPRPARIQALKWVVHLVGDIHQPFHAGYGDDKGANDFQISLRTNIQPQDYAKKHYSNGVMGTNLHAVWDYYVVARRGLGTQRYADELAARGAPPPGAPADETATGGDSKDWAAESCRIIAAESLYPPSHRINNAYLDQMQPIAERRLIQAGHRLATLLNTALSAPPPAK